MKRCLMISFILMLVMVANGCNNNDVEQIKADSINIGFGQSLYEGYNKVEKETVQSLVMAYNKMDYMGQTNEELNYDKAITIIFIYNDQLSGTLVMDDKGVFQLNDGVGNYEIEPNNDIYEQAVEIYNDLKEQY